MVSHLSRLKEELDSKKHELQEQQAAVESIEKLTRELEAQKQALAAKSADLSNRQNEVTAMKERFQKLAALEPAINAAMHTKSGTQDVAREVIERGLRSDHLTSGEIVRTTLSTAMQINGRSRRDNLDDLFDEIVTDNDSIQAAIESAMENSADVNDVVKSALVTAIDGALNADLKRSIIDTVRGVLDEKESTVHPKKKIGGWSHLNLRKHHTLEAHSHVYSTTQGEPAPARRA